MEQQLARSSLQRQALFEAIDDGFCIIQFIDGPDGPLSDYLHVEANSGYQRHTGIGNIVGKRLREIEPDNAQTWLDLYGRVLRTGETARFEQEFRAVGRHIEVSAMRVGTPDLGQVSVLFRDITARKLTEAALRDNVQRVQLALAAGAIIGTWLWDVPADCFSVDEGFAQAFGLAEGTPLSGLSLAQLMATVHADDRAALVRAMQAAQQRGGAYAHQFRTRRRDGQYRWLEANGRVELDAEGRATDFPGVLIDLEGRRALEAERDRALAALRALNETLEQRVEQRTAALLKAEDALRHAQKMDAVGQLTGGLAHDFNNLLAGIGGSLELMQLRLAQGRVEELARHVDGAQTAVRRAAALTQRLLAFSRRQTLDPRPANLNQIVASMGALIGGSVGPAIQVDSAADEGLWNTLVDVGQMENALLNLCLNARDAMPDGGRLTIATSNRTLVGAQAAQCEVAAGDYVQLAVVDTGVGMTAAVLARAVEPFFTTKPAGQGTGLGLSMVYGFAGQSGGALQLASTPGQGSCVSLLLPRYAGVAQPMAAGALAAAGMDAGAATALASASPSPSAAAAPLWRQKILLVDDEALVRAVTLEVLTDLGYDVIEAADGAAGLALAAAHGDLDLLITDVGLPHGMNGRQLADAVRARLPALPVLFITGFAEQAVLHHGNLAPGMQLLTKPYSAEALALRVGQLLRVAPAQ
ncbi:response regulator [Duganella sp. FT80W]|uniref:histidine kinase n=1 Tax=Duganella guangzhouensis TaxID=2666084 RepID=A0A6I2KVB0_9BURK|nr:hybrid sensor histidine kinase/response regulator [Duganella guangzhouensis]MRW89868.1 response regulator [Duganella guangzhouensis]